MSTIPVITEKDEASEGISTLQVIVIKTETNEKLLDTLTKTAIVSCITQKENQPGKTVSLWNGNVKEVYSLLQMTDHNLVHQIREMKRRLEQS